MTLAQFLERAGRTPFAWGRFDCCLWLADWVSAQGGSDPAAHLRARYSTALGCRRVLKREGGVLAVVTACAEIAGLEPTQEPIAGDVGVVHVMTSKGIEHAGAICTGPRWAVLSGNGLIVAPMVPAAAWRV